MWKLTKQAYKTFDVYTELSNLFVNRMTEIPIKFRAFEMRRLNRTLTSNGATDTLIN